jgi:TatD DNase family protein
MIDSHAHLTCPELLPQVDLLLQRANAAGVEQIVNICTDEASLSAGIALNARYPFVHNAAATTPHDVDREGEAFFPLVEQACRENTLVAIGETGLDYYYAHSDQKTQRQFFRRYMALALRYDLPLVIHCREAFQDFFSLVDSDYKKGSSWGPLVLHCFTGTLQEAEEVLKRGFFLSLSGIVTFRKSESLRKVAQLTPLEQLLIETDAPYLAPVPYRGKSNEPAFLRHTCELIAEVKGLDPQTVAQATAENTRKVFRLSR